MLAAKTKTNMTTTTILSILTLLTVDFTTQEKTDLFGIVTDGHRNRLIGINVMIKGTTVGRVTDTCGRFSIPVDSENFTLLFHGMSYDDMRAYEIELAKKDITSDTLIFQLGNWKAPNPICDKVGKKRNIIVID